MRTIQMIACLAIAAFASSAGADQGRGEQQVHRIAQGAPNRIVTPYDSARFVTNVEHEAWNVGGVLYVLPMSTDHTMAGFVQDETGTWAVPVVFEVARITPQEIRLTDPHYQPVAGSDPSKAPATRAGGGGHVEPIVDALVGAINHGEVSGFRQMPQSTGAVVYVGPLRMELEHVQQRADLRIERHQIVHEGTEPRQVSEASFEVPHRLGVAVYPPMTEIQPGQQAHVYIVRRMTRD